MVEVFIAAEVAAAFPETRIRLVVAEELDAGGDWDGVRAGVAGLEEALAAGRWRVFDETGPEVGSSHEAYRRFGANPRRVRPSVDALGRRLAKSGRLPRVHPAVDAYNLVSVRHGVPAGAFDLRRLDELGTGVSIRFARDGDRFTPLGEPEKVERPGAGEVVYASGDRVLTRYWNHRDCDQTKVVPASTAAVFVLERVSAAAVPDDRLDAAAEELAALLRPHAGRVSAGLLDAGSPGTAIGSGEPDRVG